ncbi:hypothetical protein M231_05636 [Tremella mesenterica]|uniref:RNA helicase n=1 Tax=Tremella mesenterica TaxID=5217 RepID=A0A4Q1BHG6_TREME|nr:hypothetical protein M231_05636 [Tremella mesenterica]
MGKKKSSLKPVNRGVVTTSVVPSKPIASVAPTSAQVPDDATFAFTPTASVVDRSTGPGEPASPTRDVIDYDHPREDWEDESLIRENFLQVLVDKLHDKGEKEVVRILKTIEYDKRLSATFPSLDFNTDIRQRILELALEEETGGGEEDKTKTISAGSSQIESERILLRLFTTYRTLSALGFSDARIGQYLLEGMSEGEGWEEALQWMWLHLSEEECLSLGEYSKHIESSVDNDQSPLLPDELPGDSVPSANPTDLQGAVTQTTMENKTLTQGTPVEPVSLFQSQGSVAPSDSESDGEPNMNLENETWARLMLELDTLRLGAGDGKMKGKKGKGAGVVLETPEMRRIKEKVGKAEREYMFNRKQADILFRALKAKREAESLEARLKGLSVGAEGTISPEPATTPDRLAEEEDTIASDDTLDDDDLGLFGNLLDQSNEPTHDMTDTTQPAIPVRQMPLPRQFPISNLPKTILRDGLRRASKQAVITFARLSGNSRPARAGLEITWSSTKRRQWRMNDTACGDMIEAENYVSTLALHDLLSGGQLNNVNWRAFPPTFRDLWEELEKEKKAAEDVKRREMWGKVKDILDKKTVDKPTVQLQPAETSSTDKIDATEKEMSLEDRYDPNLQAEFEVRRSSSAFQRMLRQRETLPIASFRQRIIETLSSSQILVLSGETGCGKSTQLPSFILEDQLSQGKPCKIFVTEPRRISAISLAQRVSQELGDAPGTLGTTSSLVGYSIRLEAKVSPSTRLAFVTNGIALRMLESGSGDVSKGTAFDQVTHIIVDEVHERSIDSDFLLIVLKSLMVQRPDLKIVLMSATLDSDKLSNYFGGCPILSVPGRTFPVQVRYLEDAVEMTGWNIDDSSSYAIRHRNGNPKRQMEWNEETAKNESDSDSDSDSSTSSKSGQKSNSMKLSSTRYSSETVETINLLDVRQTPYELIISLLENICFINPDLIPFSQAILIFLPGLAEIRRLTELINSHPSFISDFLIYPLHSTISSEGQSAVFDIPPPGVRKIVVSTNIAETGVTIPDITCVIDTGKHREMRYDEKRQLSRLVEIFISRSNAKQRRGRAGRVREGIAFHLFTKYRHDHQLSEHSIPEMLRLSLQDLALRIKILKVRLGPSIEEVLNKALDPPTSVNIQKAIAALVEVKALTNNEEITPLGRLLSKLPMDVHLGKFLLVATTMKCLDEGLTLAATLCSKSPFVTPFGYESQARAAKKGFAKDNSDFLTLINVFNAWRRASDNTNYVRTFCKKNYISHQNLQQIEELRQQLLGYLVDSGFVSVSQEKKIEMFSARFSKNTFRTRFITIPAVLNINHDKPQILNAALAAGLYPKVLVVDGNGLRSITNQQPVSIHPSSVNFGVPRSELGTHLIYFTLMRSKKLYAWEISPINEKTLIMMCGDQLDIKIPSSSLIIDRKLRYRLPPKTLVAVRILRDRLNQAMNLRFRGKELSEGLERWLVLGMECLMVDVEESKLGIVGR